MTRRVAVAGAIMWVTQALAVKEVNSESLAKWLSPRVKTVGLDKAVCIADSLPLLAPATGAESKCAAASASASAASAVGAVGLVAIVRTRKPHWRAALKLKLPRARYSKYVARA